MVNGLHELEKECSNGMVEPERIQKYMDTLQPIKDSYLTVQYIKYLIDKPNRKSRQKKYCKQFDDKIDVDKYSKIPERNNSLLKELQ